ncbi:MAG: PQQ-binding-like beta-propeller repeat protein, partial [Planctomycetota bacterium]
MHFGRAVACFALALAVSLPTSPAAQAVPLQDADASAEWSQFRGNCARTGRVNVDPLSANPKEAWRTSLDGELASNVVVSGGHAYLLRRKGKSTHLVALRLEDGNLVAKVNYRGGASPSIAVTHGTVVVSDEELTTAYRHRGKSLTRSWKHEGWVHEPPSLLDGMLVVKTVDGQSVEVVNATRGKVVETVNFPSKSPLLLFRAPDGEVRIVGAAMENRERDGYLQKLLRVQVGRLGPDITSPWVVPKVSLHDIGPLPDDVELNAAVALPPATALAPAGLWLRSARGLKTRTGAKFKGIRFELDVREPDVLVNPLDRDPVVRANHAVGFTSKGDLVGILPDGSYFEYIKRSRLPRGVRPGATSAAGDVIFFGNWALHATSYEILWSLPELDPAGAAIPVSGRRVVVPVREAGKKVSIVCLESANADGSETEAKTAEKAPEVLPPLSGVTGVLLRDGRLVKSAEGVPPEDIATVLDKGKATGIEDEPAILQAWRGTLHARVHDVLEARFRHLARERLVTASAAVLEEAREWNMPRARIETLQQLVSGRSDAANAAGRLGILKKGFDGEWKESRALALDAARWCLRYELNGAAACLVNDAARLGAAGEDCTKILSASVPAEFPWKSRDDAAARWATWAEELVSVDAVFVPADEK